MEHGAGSRGARGRARDADAAPCELPEDFAPSESMLKWAERKYPGLDLDFETGQFIYHYRAHGDRRKSWPDQWQKWLGDSWQRRKLSGGPARTGMATSDARVVAGLGLAVQYAEEEQAAQRKELLP